MLVDERGLLISSLVFIYFIFCTSTLIIKNSSKVDKNQPSSACSESCPYFQLSNSLAAKVLLLQCYRQAELVTGANCFVVFLAWAVTHAGGIQHGAWIHIQSASVHESSLLPIHHPNKRQQNTLSIISLWSRCPHIWWTTTTSNYLMFQMI